MTDNKNNDESVEDSVFNQDDKNHDNKDAPEGTPNVVDIDAEPSFADSDDNESDEQDQLQDLEAQLAAKDEEIMRMAAEGMNAQKRLQRELDNTRKYSNDKIIKALIPVMDSFDKALEIVNDENYEVTVEAMVEGTVNTQQTLSKVLTEYGIEIINPVGEKFDPDKHEAMTMVESDDHEKNTVVNVFQKGYLLHGRVIRAAMVVVAR